MNVSEVSEELIICGWIVIFVVVVFLVDPGQELPGKLVFPDEGLMIKVLGLENTKVTQGKQTH